MANIPAITFITTSAITLEITFYQVSSSIRNRISNHIRGLIIHSHNLILLVIPGSEQNLIYPLAKVGHTGDLMAGTAPHKHCVVCGNAVEPDANFCDELCESRFKSAQRRQQLMFVAFIAIMVLILVLPSLLKLKG